MVQDNVGGVHWRIYDIRTGRTVAGGITPRHPLPTGAARPGQTAWHGSHLDSTYQAQIWTATPVDSITVQNMTFAH